jgi:hypothetical protein
MIVEDSSKSKPSEALVENAPALDGYPLFARILPVRDIEYTQDIITPPLVLVIS